MVIIRFILPLFLCAVVACNDVAPANQQKKPAPAKLAINVNEIVFGLFCGECMGHCATIYRYNIEGNTNSLWVDSTDSFFSKKGRGEDLHFSTPIPHSDTASWNAASHIIQNIPSRLLNSDKESETFGCPDCTDGCGLFLGIRSNSGTHKFFIDTYDKEIKDDDVRAFADILGIAIAKMGKSKE